MPKFALANLCWGGREHPAYQGLTPAARALLGRGRAIHRMLILRHADEGSEAASKALTGNTVLVSQPKTSAILAELPPDEPEMSDSLNVVFATARSDISKHKSLPVPRARYVKCALLRKAVCLEFAEVTVSEEKAQSLLAEDDVPPCLVEAAVPLDEARYFRPNFDGPATLRDPTAKPVEDSEDVAHERDVQPDAKEGVEEPEAEEGTGA